jgi:NADPH:quinone reductase-like Zn-dependent oxidoreductase
MNSMKAVRIHAYGGREVLRYEEAPRPSAGEGDVLIRVHSSSVNPFDIAVRAGYVAGYFNYTLPLILGSDVSGVVEAVGPGVTDVAPGEVVYTRAGVYRDGANAEYVLATAADVAPKPQSLDHVHAAALPHVVLTAWQALYEVAQLSAGQTVLIHAAAGGVGHVAVQLAHLRGAKVIGTASVNAPRLRDLGVEEIIDYSTTAFESRVRDVDVVLDLVGEDTQPRSWGVLKPGGILISTVQPPSEAEAAAHGVRTGFIATAPPMRPTLTEVGRLVDTGQLKPIVSTVYPLAEIQQAHAELEAKHNYGKIVLHVAE